MFCSSWRCPAVHLQAQQPGHGALQAAVATLLWVVLVARCVTKWLPRLLTWGWRVCLRSRTHTFQAYIG
jgi:hypothetical protein